MLKPSSKSVRSLAVGIAMAAGTYGLATNVARADGPYQINFYNHAWAQVKLEVRAGNYQNCDQNQTQTVEVLLLNGGYQLYSSASVICYRRTADPTHPSSEWGGWYSISPNSITTTMNVELN
jgi:hypothetical protein